MTSCPENVALRRGETARFSCGTDDAEHVNWKHRPAGSNADNFIYKSGSIIAELASKYRVTRNSSNYELIIVNTSILDGGTYICIDRVGLGDWASAELIVIGNNMFYLLCVIYGLKFSFNI